MQQHEYYSTVNLPGCPRYEKAWFPDDPRTAVLVSKGLLVPVQRALTEPLPEPPQVAEPAAAPDSGTASPDPPPVPRSSPRKPRSR